MFLSTQQARTCSISIKSLAEWCKHLLYVLCDGSKHLGEQIEGGSFFFTAQRTSAQWFLIYNLYSRVVDEIVH